MIALLCFAYVATASAQDPVSLKFSGYYPPTLAQAPVTNAVATEVVAHAHYMAQNPFCRENGSRAVKDFKISVKTNLNNTGYAFSVPRQLGPPCGFILISINFGLVTKGSDSIFSGILMTEGPQSSGSVRQLPLLETSRCELENYAGSHVVFCQAQDNSGPSYYLPEDWSVQNFKFNFVAYSATR